VATTSPMTSRDLADYHAVLAADVKDFTSNADIDNRILARRLPQVLGEAFARSGLDFSKVRFPGQAGDSYAVGVDYHKLPHLIYPLLDRLQDVLAELDAGPGKHSASMRLRVSIHIGHLPSEPDADGPAGIGKAMNDLHRLLDANPARHALRDSDPATTFVAAVISQRAYEDAVLSGACPLPISRITPISVHIKQFTGGAWLYVPEPSGPALHRGFMSSPAEGAGDPPAKDPERGRDATESGTPTPTFNIGTAGQVAGTVTAPVTVRQTIHGSAGKGRYPMSHPSPTDDHHDS
jgi:hypothetical protein